MEKSNRDALLGNAVRIDVDNHKKAEKGHVDCLIFSETLGLLKSHPDEITDEWIQEAIENREKMKQSCSLNHFSEWELTALNQLKKHIRQSFPNSFSN
jgi:hypothetical protein